MNPDTQYNDNSARQARDAAALGGVVIDDSGFVRPGDRRCAAGELEVLDTVE